MTPSLIDLLLSARVYDLEQPRFTGMPIHPRIGRAISTRCIGGIAIPIGPTRMARAAARRVC